MSIMRITHGVGMTIIIMGPVSDRMFSDTFSKKKMLNVKIEPDRIDMNNKIKNISVRSILPDSSPQAYY